MASIDELTEELNQTKHDLQRANLLLEEMNKTVDTLENENNDLSEKIRDLKEELKETKKNLRLEKSSTLSLKKENKDEVNILRKEIEIEKNKQKNILEKLKIESGMEQEMEYLRTDIEEKNNEINLLKEEISILKSKNFEMGMDLDTKNDEYNELVERFNELNENFKDLELVNNENLKEITSLRCNLLEEKVTKNELLQKVEEAEGRIDENVILKNIIESRDLEITQLSDSSKEGVDNEYLVKMENEILEKNILIKNLEKNLKEVEKKNNKLCRMYRNSFIKISEKNNKLDNQNLIIGELKNSLNNEKEKTKLLNEEMNVLEESIFNNNCSIPPLPSALSLEDLKESISNNNRSRPPLPSAPSLEDLKESISNNNCSRPPLPSAPPLTELEENITTNQTDIKKNEVNTINHPLKFTLNLSINGCQEKNVNLLMSNDENKIVQNFMNENINVS
uniref:Uncharacterized protein n=1 Tax=Strongyloides papillosus TaxID=174720 RepID=A0A0N5C6H4_STREA